MCRFVPQVVPHLPLSCLSSFQRPVSDIRMRLLSPRSFFDYVSSRMVQIVRNCCAPHAVIRSTCILNFWTTRRLSSTSRSCVHLYYRPQASRPKTQDSTLFDHSRYYLVANRNFFMKKRGLRYMGHRGSPKLMVLWN